MHCSPAFLHLQLVQPRLDLQEDQSQVVEDEHDSLPMCCYSSYWFYFYAQIIGSRKDREVVEEGS